MKHLLRDDLFLLLCKQVIACTDSYKCIREYAEGIAFLACVHEAGAISPDEVARLARLTPETAQNIGVKGILGFPHPLFQDRGLELFRASWCDVSQMMPTAATCAPTHTHTHTHTHTRPGVTNLASR